jgi:hypothetical protein
LYKRQDRFGYKVVSALDMVFTLSSLKLHHSCPDWYLRLQITTLQSFRSWPPVIYVFVCFWFHLLFCRKSLPFSLTLEQLPFSSISGKMHNSSVPGTNVLSTEKWWFHTKLM